LGESGGQWIDPQRESQERAVASGELPSWITVIHFVVFGLIGMYGTLDDWRDGLKALLVFEPRELGLLNATTLWLYCNSVSLVRALTIADLAAALLMFKLALRSPKPKYNIVYMSAILCTAAIHAGAIAYLWNIRVLRTSGATYVFEGITPLIVADFVIVVPAVLMLLGSLLVGWHGPASGFCPACGYDLRATPAAAPSAHAWTGQGPFSFHRRLIG
jgi:hypothetical protein